MILGVPESRWILELCTIGFCSGVILFITWKIEAARERRRQRRLR